MTNDATVTRVRVLEGELREFQLRHDAVFSTDPVREQIFADQVRRAEAELAEALTREQSLIVRSPGTGTFVVRRPGEMIGHYAHEGELLGVVAAFDAPIVVAVIPEESADLVRSRTRRVEVRLIDAPSRVYEAEIAREIPSINDRLPSPALSTLGGGEAVLDPRAGKELRTLTKVLHLELRFTDPVSVRGIGGRAYARFDHGDEPLAWRLYTGLRQLFLRHFGV